MKWHSSARALCGWICAAIAACSVGPRYQRPDVALSTEWHETLSPSEATASIWPDAGWWQAFGSPQLDQLIAQAEHRNDDLAGAVARVEEADAQAAQAAQPARAGEAT